MALDTYALISVAEYMAWAGVSNEDIEVDGIKLYCTQTDTTDATAAKASDTLTLIIDSGAEAGTEAIDLTDTSYDTLTELVAYINTLTGWTAELCSDGWTAEDSTRLKDFEQVQVIGEERELTVMLYDYQTIENLINRATDDIESFLRRSIKSRDYTLERYDGTGRKVFLMNYPVTAITQVSDGVMDAIRVKCADAAAYNAYVSVDSDDVILTKDGAAAGTLAKSTYTTLGTMATAINAVSGWEGELLSSDYTSWPVTLLHDQPNVGCANANGNLQVPTEPLEVYDADLTRGIIYQSVGYSRDWRNVFVSYTAGYSTVPGFIVAACLEYVKYLSDSGEQDYTMKSEKLGDYSYTMAELEKALAPSSFEALRRFMRRMV